MFTTQSPFPRPLRSTALVLGALLTAAAVPSFRAAPANRSTPELRAFVEHGKHHGKRHGRRHAKNPGKRGCGGEIPFKYARIYWEYNASADDLGVHVTLDAEDWTRLRIENPNDRTLFEVKGKGPYGNLGMTELFFEGAEPSL
ncbi:MAG: hypothetical protein KDC87_02165, partial [Planctomycetes bacterium]|nr:hypothetical protein [Planctomycetota bacterium]